MSGEIGAPRVLRGHVGRVTSVVFAPDGKSIFSSSIDGTVRQWEAASGAPGLVREAGNDKLLCLACADDGRWLVAGGQGRSVHLWNLSKPAPQPALSLGGHAGAVAAMTFAADRPLLASAGDDNSLLLWNLTGLAPETPPALRPGIVPQRLEGHLQPVQCLAFSPRGDRLATASQDGTIRLWATESGTSYQVLKTAAFIQSLAFDAGDFSLSGVGHDRALRVWHASYGIAFAAKEGRYLKLKALSEIGGGEWTAVGEIQVFAGQALVPAQRWKLVSVDSEAQDSPATFAFDGNPRTFWCTRWRSRPPRHPHEIVIDLGQAYRLTSFSVLPRHDGNSNGTIQDYELYVGNDLENLGPPVSHGRLANGPLRSP